MEDAVSRPVFEMLERLDIAYTVHRHPAVFTVDQAIEHWAGIDAAHCKNLFLRNKKGTRHYLVVAEHLKPVDLGLLADRIGDDRLSFASPERLGRYLGLTPGSVSPFGLIHDVRHEVQVVIDADLRECPRVAFHPNINTATVVISMREFERFLESTGNPVRFLKL
jgi:Ala-tRNA(Pro) deacylase